MACPAPCVTLNQSVGVDGSMENSVTLGPALKECTSFRGKSGGDPLVGPHHPGMPVEPLSVCDEVVRNRDASTDGAAREGVGVAELARVSLGKCDAHIGPETVKRFLEA